MKTPLRFQVTEFDCGTIALFNAFSFLFERREIPAELIRAIEVYTLDCHDEFGKLGEAGTSREAILKLTHWITQYANEHRFNVTCQRLEKEFVTEKAMRECLKSGGCVFARCWQDCEHYVLITKMDSKYVYIFDSYYLDKTEYDHDSQVKLIFNKPFTHNRKVTLKRLFSLTKQDFSLGEIKGRECVLIQRIKTKK